MPARSSVNGCGMSPELETLDQLLGGPMPLATIRTLYPDAEAFRAGVGGLLKTGEVLLCGANDAPLPAWQYREILGAESCPGLTLKITDKGAARIG
jgi:hypothetical protein